MMSSGQSASRRRTRNRTPCTLHTLQYTDRRLSFNEVMGLLQMLPRGGGAVVTNCSVEEGRCRCQCPVVAVAVDPNQLLRLPHCIFDRELDGYCSASVSKTRGMKSKAKP